MNPRGNISGRDSLLAAPVQLEICAERNRDLPLSVCDLCGRYHSGTPQPFFDPESSSTNRFSDFISAALRIF
jgi:hypothetical protein